LAPGLTLAEQPCRQRCHGVSGGSQGTGGWWVPRVVVVGRVGVQGWGRYVGTLGGGVLY